MTLPPLDKYKRFHPANLHSIFSRIGFHIFLSLNLVPKGRPKYFIGRLYYLQPRTFNNKSKFCTIPIGTNSDLPKFIFRPETTSNQMRIYGETKPNPDQHHKKLKYHPQREDETLPKIFPLNDPHQSLTCDHHEQLYPTFSQGLP